MSERAAARLLALALALAPAAALAEAETRAVWPAPPRATLLLLADPSMSIEPGVRTIESLTPLLFAYDAELSARLAYDESTTGRRALGALGRFGKAVLLDAPLVQLEDTLVHEIFGHGSRAREFGQNPVYDFRLPFPYRFLAGPSAYSGLTYLLRTGRMDTDVPVTAAGMEANFFEAWWTQARVLRGGGQAHYADLLRYVSEKASYLPRWTEDLSQSPGPGGSSSDPDAYLDELQRRFNLYTPQSRADTARALSRAYVWNAVDPTLWLAVYHLMFTYGWGGERVSTLPRFHFGETWAYPGTRFNLSPFGAEHYLDLFAGRGERMISAYLRLGSSGLASYAGAGLRAFGFEVRPGLVLGGELDLFRQPELLFEYRDAFDGRTLVGGGAALHAEYRVWGRVGVVGKLAAKTRGYLMGQPLAAGPYGYLGLSLALDARPGN